MTKTTDVSDVMIAIIAEAIHAGDIGFRMELVRLVEGESTYRLTYYDGRPPLEFGGTDELYAHVGQTKRQAQAAHVLAALGEDNLDSPIARLDMVLTCLRAIVTSPADAKALALAGIDICTLTATERAAMRGDAK